ncbi:B-4DMT family transporter [Actinophytocola glycyrrhizae]|uniref:B-4DMT family transporter n=1 Tax=Actinophytocola glycyrrhizae TaxID=2044873 RepID=A0ABV9S9L1_9PSEU
MRTWLLRGAVMAVVHAVAETVRADFGVHHPTSRTLFEALVLGALVGVAAVWGAVDRWRDVEDAGRAWLIGSLVAGWCAAVLAVIGKSAFVDQTGVADLGGALTGGAAFTALLVLIPAAIGLAAGHWIRSSRPAADEDAEADAQENAEEDEDEPQRGGPTRSRPRS